MTRRGHAVLVGVGLLLSLGAAEREAAEPPPVAALRTLLQHSPVLILGETHHQPDSARLVAETVAAALQAGECLTVALEIPADQQSALDAGLRGEQPLSAIAIHPIIDHPAYRDLLRRFRALRQAGLCLTVRAIDAPPNARGARDAWMADAVQRLAGSGPVLVVVGNFHALKRVRWVDGRDDPFLAERLLRRGVPVLSVLQAWEADCAQRTGRFLPVRQPRAVAALRALVSSMALQPHHDLTVAADAVVVWECRVPRTTAGWGGTR